MIWGKMEEVELLPTRDCKASYDTASQWRYAKVVGTYLASMEKVDPKPYIESKNSGIRYLV